MPKPPSNQRQLAYFYSPEQYEVYKFALRHPVHGYVQFFSFQKLEQVSYQQVSYPHSEYSTSDYCICAAWIESLNDDGHDYDYRCSVMKTRREMDTKIPAMTKTDTVSTAGTRQAAVRQIYLTKYNYIHSQNP